MSIATILQHKGSNVFTIPLSARVRDAVAALNEHRIGALLVISEGSVVGVLSERDVVRGLHRGGAEALERPVRACMTSPVVTIAPEDSINEAMALMTHRRIRHLPVMAGGRLAGLVSIGDLVAARIAEAEREAALLKDYIASA